MYSTSSSTEHQDPAAKSTTHAGLVERAILIYSSPGDQPQQSRSLLHPAICQSSADVGIRSLIDFDRNHSTTFNYGIYQRDLWRQTFPVAKIPA